MKYLAVTLSLLGALSVGCIEPEQDRTYEAFAADYRALQDGTYEGPTFDMGASDIVATPDVAPVDMALPTADVCSTNGPAVNVQFINATGVDGDIYWVDYACAQLPYGALGADETRPQATFEGHVWRLYSPQRQLLGEIVVTGPEGAVLRFE